MRRVALWSAALVVCAAALIAVPLSCQRVTVAEDWTPGRLHQELERAGRHYVARSRFDIFDGLLLKKADDAMTWEELAAHFNDTSNPPRRGCLLVYSLRGSDLATNTGPGLIQLRHLLIRGHPDDLREIEGLFGE